MGKLTSLKNNLKKVAGNNMKEDLIIAWNELEEVTANFDQISGRDLIDILPTIQQRVTKARDLVGKYVKDTDVEKYLGL